MHRLKFLIIALVFISFKANSQYNIELGVNLGVSNYLGEIGGAEKNAQPFILDLTLSQTRWAAGIFTRYKFDQRFAVNAGFNTIRIQGADSLSTNPGRVGRNLSFKNDIYEFYTRGEFTFLNFYDFGGRGRYNLEMSAYLFAGIGGFVSTPKAKWNHTWYALQPLQTEGISYNKFGVMVPYGMGMYFTYRHKSRFGFEWSARKTFTDYLDDISSIYPDLTDMDPTAAYFSNRTADVPEGSRPHANNYSEGNKRGEAADNDTYLTFTFYYSYVFKGRNSFYRQKYNWLIGSGRKSKRRSRAKF